MTKFVQYIPPREDRLPDGDCCVGTAAKIPLEFNSKTRNIIINCNDSQATIMAMNKTIKVKSRNTITAITEFGQLLAMDNQVLLGWILAHKGYNM